MNAFRSACLVAIVGSMIACSPSTSNSDSGNSPDSGACTPESNQALCTANGYACGSGTWLDNCGTSRTVASCGTCSGTLNTCSTTTWQCVAGTPTDAGPDAGDAGPTADAGTDAGQDAGPPPNLSCPGVANCVQSQPSISIQGAITCEGEGTTSAGDQFTPLLECAMGCASSPDAGGCLLAVTNADGGACASEWVTCQNDGVSCATILGCAATPAGQADPEFCVLQGNAQAIQLAEAALGCVQTVCTTDAGFSTSCAASAPTGACATQFGACAGTGPSCRGILGCIQDIGTDGGETGITVTQCVESGNATSIPLAQTFLGCAETACPVPDGGSISLSCAMGTTVDGGACFSSFNACASDTSGCVPETDSQLCAQESPPWYCGTLPVTDNCGNQRMANCGTCATNATCNTTSWTCDCNEGFQGDAGTGNGSNCTPDAG